MKNKIIFIILVAFLLVPTTSAVGITQNNTVSTSRNPYIEQGQIVYVNDTVDISGVVPPYPYLAYWNGYDMYESNATYIIDLPTRHSAYYNFTLDPSVFANRLGKWYKYSGKFERQGNNIAFVVRPEIFKNSTMRFQNGTLINISEIVEANTSMLDVEVPPPVPVKHISDYLIARGDSWNISVNQPTNVWIFGAQDHLLQMSSVNNSIDIDSKILRNLHSGDYKVMFQTIRNGSSTFNVKYDAGDTSIKWFDPKTFKVYSENIYGYSAQVTKMKFDEIVPQTQDNFVTYNLALQEPTLEIISVSELFTPNWTVDETGEKDYNTNVSLMYVKGYTNVAPGTQLTFIMDSNRTPKNYLGTKKALNIANTTVKGSYGGDERWFEAYVPFNKYNTALGDHFITGYTPLSDSTTTVKFTLYNQPPDHFVPSKEIRYTSGEYGPQEFVPTPTPVIEKVTVVQTIKVVETIMIPVTPSNEVVKAQQQKVMDETISTWATRIFIVVAVIGLGAWAVSLYLRRKDREE